MIDLNWTSHIYSGAPEFSDIDKVLSIKLKSEADRGAWIAKIGNVEPGEVYTVYGRIRLTAEPVIPEKEVKVILRVFNQAGAVIQTEKLKRRTSGDGSISPILNSATITTTGLARLYLEFDKRPGLAEFIDITVVPGSIPEPEPEPNYIVTYGANGDQPFEILDYADDLIFKFPATALLLHFPTSGHYGIQTNIKISGIAEWIGNVGIQGMIIPNFGKCRIRFYTADRALFTIEAAAAGEHWLSFSYFLRGLGALYMDIEPVDGWAGIRYGHMLKYSQLL